MFLWTNSKAFSHVYDTFNCMLQASTSFVLDCEKWTLLKKDNAFLIWTGFILLFVNFQEIFFLSNHNIKKYVSKEKKRINRWVGYGLEIPTEYRFYGNERALNWAKTALDGIDGNVKKSCRCLKQSHFQKKSVTSYLRFIFFWPVGRYFSQW